MEDTKDFVNKELKEINSKDLQEKINENLERVFEIGDKTTVHTAHKKIQECISNVLEKYFSEYEGLKDYFTVGTWSLEFKGIMIAIYDFTFKFKTEFEYDNIIIIEKIPKFEFILRFYKNDSLYNFIIRLLLEKEVRNFENTIEHKEILEHEEIIKEIIKEKNKGIGYLIDKNEFIRI